MPFASKEKAENDLGERYGCRQGNALAFTFPEIGEGVTAVTDEVDTRAVSYYKTEYLLTPFSAFSFDAKGPKEKAWQKENADKGVSPLRRRQGLRALDCANF